MSDNQNYTEWTLETLLTEEKKLKQKGIISAVLIGVALGILVYGIVKNGFGFLHIFLPLVLIYWFNKEAEKNKLKLKEVRAAIEHKNTK